jgi:squalene-hopene/tetraprenyl-beta-curcumene cyclase
MRTLLCLTILFAFASFAFAEELTLENVTAPEPNTTEEPFAESFSLESATRFLDQASLDWTKSRECFTCHTNFSYLMARPAISADAKAHQQIRTALEELVEKRWPDKGPRWDAEVVMGAAALALNDNASTGKLHPTTQKALDRMWTVQQENGGFDWLKCGWPPMESDDEYGAAIALIATHSAPNDYAKTETAQKGLQKLRDYLKQNPPPTLHHTAMLLWADSYGAGSLTAEQKEAGIEKLLSLQKPSGGWSFATLGDWERADGKQQDTNTSDGYATGFVVYVLRRSGISADNEQIRKGIAWLKSNQRASGRWYTRSLNKDSKHFISHAGSAFAVLALASCEE